MSETTAATYARWAIERRARQRVAEEIAAALEGMVPIWSANTESMGDGIDKKRALQIVREVGGISTGDKTP